MKAKRYVGLMVLVMACSVLLTENVFADRKDSQETGDNGRIYIEEEQIAGNRVKYHVIAQNADVTEFNYGCHVFSTDSMSTAGFVSVDFSDEFNELIASQDGDWSWFSLETSLNGYVLFPNTQTFSGEICTFLATMIVSPLKSIQIEYSACSSDYEIKETIDYYPDRKWFQKGDVDFDGKFTATDALWILENVVKLNQINDQEFSLYDVDDNGSIGAEDALCVLKKVVKLN